MHWFVFNYFPEQVKVVSFGADQIKMLLISIVD